MTLDPKALAAGEKAYMQASQAGVYSVAVAVAIQAYLAALPSTAGEPVALGWKLVPVEVTLDMQKAYFDVIDKNMPRVEKDLRFGRFDSNREAYRAMISAAPLPPPPVAPQGRGDHPDDVAVDRFAAAMKGKLAKKRAEGRGGWENKDECTAEFLSELLRGHVEKGDPLDVGNFAMMLHQRGERITPAPLTAVERADVVEALLPRIFEQRRRFRNRINSPKDRFPMADDDVTELQAANALLADIEFALKAPRS